MPSILTVDPGLMRRVDTRNTENLFSMWSVFSRCAGSLEEGRRLENLSWRLWNRETFCCAPGEVNLTTPAISIAQRSSDGKYSSPMPELSKSVDSLADEEAIESDMEENMSSSGPLDITRPRIRRQDSGSSWSRGRERHITPDDLEKMVITIKEKKDLEPIDIGTHSYLAPLAEHNVASVSPSTAGTAVSDAQVATSASPSAVPATIQPASSKSLTVASFESAASERSTTSIVRGFSTANVSSSYRTIPLIDNPSSIPTSELTSHPVTSTSKKPAVFALGGSSQSGDESFNDSPVETRIQQVKKKANNMFQLGGSSCEEDNSMRNPCKSKSSLRNCMADPSTGGPLHKKHTSFNEEVVMCIIPVITHSTMDDVFESDEDEIDESAIDDESDWEDSDEVAKSSSEEKLSFHRVDSRPNLVSRRSLITTMLHQTDRATGLANAASRSTPAMQRSRTASPIGPSLATSPDSDDAAPLMMKKPSKVSAEIPRSVAQPIIKTSTNMIPHQPALSPKTTRRQMLATELTASLRRHLLWERQQKNQTAAAVLKRRHTAQDVVGLKQYPERVHLGGKAGKSDEKDAADHGSWNQYFGTGLGEYHSKGW